MEQNTIRNVSRLPQDARHFGNNGSTDKADWSDEALRQCARIAKQQYMQGEVVSGYQAIKRLRSL
jgi:hypothetical protein